MYRIIYFSPTGNAKYVAGLLADNLQVAETQALEHLEPESIKSAEHLILVYAIHAFNAPRTVKRFVKELPTGCFEKVSLIAVGCNTSWVNDAVSKDLRKMFASKGCKLIVDEVMAMPLTFIMAFPDDVAQGQVDDAKTVIKSVALLIQNEQKSQRDIPLRSHAVNFVGRGESGAARLFGLELHATSNCTSCGLCSRECPEKNIKMLPRERPKFGFKCSMCMRCIYDCPEKAIKPYISRFIPISKGYDLQKYL